MKNPELAEIAYKGYVAYLQKQEELQEELHKKRKEADAAETEEEKSEIYDEMEAIRGELRLVRGCVNARAKLIVKYVFG